MFEDERQPLDDSPQEKPGDRTDSPGQSVAARRGLLVLFALLFSGILITFGLVLLNGYRHSMNENCASDLHQIGIGILLYCNENGGVFPDSFVTLAKAEQLMPIDFVCPATNDNVSSAPTTQGQIDDLIKPGHLSYVYIGKGLTSKTVDASVVIVYEPMSNHGNGMNVLLGDGHSEFVDAKRAMKVIADANAGTRPVILLP